MKWAIIGASGLLGSTVLQYLEQMGEPALGFHRGNMDLDSKPAELAAVLVDSDVILNAVGYTNVDLAESNFAAANFANAVVPERLAEVAKLTGASLIHISTDFIFDGAATKPYSPDDLPNPLSVYGQTKLLGEQAALSYVGSSVVRTAWMYGAKSHCFPKRVAQKLREGKLVRVVDDQVGSPTNAEDVAQFLIQLTKSDAEQRIFHAVSQGQGSWYEFALEIADKIPTGKIEPISSAELAQVATRPLYSVLDSSLLSGFEMPYWRSAWSTSWARVIGAV